MANKKGLDVLGILLVAVVFAALVVAVVGMFVGQVSYKQGAETQVIKLFEDWDNRQTGKIIIVGVSNVFGIISFVVTIIGLATLLVDGIFHYLLGKDILVIRIVGIALSFVGSILILAAGLVMAGRCDFVKDAELANTELWLAAMHMKFSAGIGVWLGFTAGLVGAGCGGLWLLEIFK